LRIRLIRLAPEQTLAATKTTALIRLIASGWSSAFACETPVKEVCKTHS
jgi:hypothetical protein